MFNSITDFYVGSSSRICNEFGDYAAAIEGQRTPCLGGTVSPDGMFVFKNGGFPAKSSFRLNPGSPSLVEC
jgi:hypothetical protein